MTLLCAMAVACSTFGQVSPAAPRDDRAAVAAPARLSRADVAEVFLAFERAFRQHPPEDAAELNRAFDDATIRFFGGQDVAKGLREMTDGLRFGGAVTPNQAYASSLRVSVRPAVLNLASPQPVTITVGRLYEAQAVGAVSVRIVSQNGRAVFEAPVTEVPAEIPMPRQLGVGSYRVQIEAAGEPQFGTRLVVTERSLAEIRDELLKDVAELEAPEQALAAFRARARLLSDTPSRKESAQFLTDPLALREDLAAESAALQAGRDPYKARAGDYWRVFSFRGLEIPCRVYAPAGAVGGAAPLVVALHGAGGDENMWMAGYGAGLIKELADKHGFIVLSPRTELFIGNIAAFDAVLDAMRALYSIDRTYLVGHSLGAMTSTALGVQRPERIAAACLFAGTGRIPVDRAVPPMLVISGDLDPLMRAAQVETGVAAAAKAGRPVELRMLKGRGHTLLVVEELPAAVEWLLKRKGGEGR